jgi:uncharacterized membrane protein YkoI
MKINRFIALGAIALLVVATMGAISMKVFAQSSSPAGQSQDCPQDTEGTDVESADQTDTDTVECGDQNAADGQEAADTANSGNDESAGEQETAPTGTPTITAEAAQKTAEEYLKAGTATKVELDEENGKLVYGVEFAGGTDVKVDAMTGKVLTVETGQD